MSRISGSPLILLDAVDKIVADAPALLALINGLVADTAALAALRLGDSAPFATGEGLGTVLSDNYASRVSMGTTGLRKTQVLCDIDGLASVATDNDAIGITTTADAHFGRLIDAETGTIIGGKVECLQTPAGGEPDVDFFADAALIAADADASGDNSLVDRNGDWAAGDVRVFTGLPDANDYIYITVGKGGGDAATYTAGIFLITFYGV